MTKSELILKITSKNSYLYHKDVYKIIDTLFNCVTKALKDGDRVELSINNFVNIFLVQIRILTSNF